MTSEATPGTPIHAIGPDAPSGTPVSVIVDRPQRASRVSIDIVHAYAPTRRSVALIMRHDRSSRTPVVLRAYRTARGPIRFRRYRSPGRPVGIGRDGGARTLIQALGGYRTARTSVRDLQRRDAAPGCPMHVRADRTTWTSLEVQVRHAASRTPRPVRHQGVPGAAISDDRATILRYQRGPRRAHHHHAVPGTPIIGHIRDQGIPRAQHRIRHQRMTRTQRDFRHEAAAR
jgi:hypothetical protein